MSSSSDDDACLEELVQSQERLYAYIVSLMGHAEDARDVLQETNSFILSHANDYEQGTSFLAWSCRIAFFKVKAYWRQKKRGRLLFDEALLEIMAEKSFQKIELAVNRKEVLQGCLEKLPGDKREMLRQRYEQSMSVSEIATGWGKTYAATTAMFYRLRVVLMDCVERAIASEVQSP